MEPIQAARAQVTVPIQGLLDLPEGAAYAVRDGRASVTARKQGDSIVITGDCDSLQRQSLRIEQRNERREYLADTLKSSAEEHRSELNLSEHRSATMTKQEKVTPQRVFKWFLIGVLLGVMLTTLLCKTNIIKNMWSALKFLYI